MAGKTKTKNGGFDRSEISSARQVYESIREDVLSLTLPPGEPIDEIKLAKRFGVSRSPVREALIRLESDGLIRMTPNKGTTVSPMHIEDFPQYIDALDLIQRTVTHLAALQRSDDDLANMERQNEIFKSAVQRHDVVDMIDANRNFHLAIGAAAQNKHFAHIYQRLLDEGRRINRLYFKSYNDKPPPYRVSAHGYIIEAIRDKDAALAERLAHEHAVRLGERFIAYLSTRMTSTFSVSLPFADGDGLAGDDGKLTPSDESQG